jgi:hypothetical protein
MERDKRVELDVEEESWRITGETERYRSNVGWQRDE